MTAAAVLASIALGDTAWAEGEPWRLHEAVSAPTWLRFGLEHRSRFEHLASDFRAEAAGDSTALLLRTLLSLELDLHPVVLAVEFQDARALAAEGTPLNPTLVNPLELLRAQAGLRAHDLFLVGDTASVDLGRMTMDVGSRRLVARNEFRNTINAFTGADVSWTSAERHQLRAFLVFPVLRLPTEPERLADNELALDQENTGAVFWGLYYRSPRLGSGLQLEAYVLGLHEGDTEAVASSNRRLLTPGVRIQRPPSIGNFDLELELMLQLGRSRASAQETDTTDLRHLALSAHAAVGRQFAVPGLPRVVFQYDYASGDHDPNDDQNQRFDLLFGARRFELGPTGLYGLIARSNMSSPGLRVELNPAPRVDAFVAHRLIWLASGRDAWTTAAVRDPDGLFGTFLGQQIEGRVRWHALPGNLSFDVGAAGLIRGNFASNAPGTQDEAPIFLYTQLTGTI